MTGDDFVAVFGGGYLFGFALALSVVWMWLRRARA